MGVMLKVARNNNNGDIDYNTTVSLLMDTIDKFEERGIKHLVVYATTPNSCKDEDKEYLQRLLDDAVEPLETDIYVKVK